MDHSNLEKDNRDKIEIIEDTIEEIALSVSEKYITDDNPSRTNGLTSLEQILVFELQDYIDKQYTLNYLKAKVWVFAMEYDFSEEDNLSDEEDVICVNETPYPIENTVDIYSKEMTAIIDKIAHHVFLGNITDDNISLTNFSNSLEQLVYYVLRDEIFGENEYNKIMALIQSKYIALRTGSCFNENMSYKGFSTTHFIDFDL